MRVAPTRTCRKSMFTYPSCFPHACTLRIAHPYVYLHGARPYSHTCTQARAFRDVFVYNRIQSINVVQARAHASLRLQTGFEGREQSAQKIREHESPFFENEVKHFLMRRNYAGTHIHLTRRCGWL